MIIVHHLNDSRSASRRSSPTTGKRAAFPNLDAWVKRLHARPAYKKALEKDGPYRFDK